jgi:hypothetical protein
VSLELGQRCSTRQRRWLGSFRAGGEKARSRPPQPYGRIKPCEAQLRPFTSLHSPLPSIGIIQARHNRHNRSLTTTKTSQSQWTNFRSPPRPNRACRTSAPKTSRSSTSSLSARPRRHRSSLVRAPQFCKQRPPYVASEIYLLFGA